MDLSQHIFPNSFILFAILKFMDKNTLHSLGQLNKEFQLKLIPIANRYNKNAYY